MTGPSVREWVEAPEGMRWASGGGSPIGECNGLHLAPIDKRGTICGRHGPATVKASRGATICGNCARIAKVARRV